MGSNRDVLFSVMFSNMLMNAFQDSDTGFPLRWYHFDGNVKVQTGVLDERKAKSSGPLADYMTLACSICNRQIRAIIGLVSHTHEPYSRNNDGLCHK